MHNLENISYTQVTHPSLITYSDWRNSLRPNYKIVYRDILLGYAALIVILLLSTFFPAAGLIFFVLKVGFCSLLLGLILAYLSLFLHEAGHYNLHANKKKNDRFAMILLGVLFGTDIKSYRKIHWQHHLHLGTPADTEISYFKDPGPGFFWESFTGIHLLKVIAGKKQHTLLTRQMKSDSLKMLIAAGFVNTAIISGLAWAHYWAAALSWLAGLLIFFPFFAALRQILEHRNELAEKKADYTKITHGKISRLFTSDIFSRVLGGAGFNKHMIHHWDPQISYTRLDEIENFLLQCEETKEIVSESRTSYFKTFQKLVIKNFKS